MRLIKYDGEEAKITEEDRRKLMGRFNPKGFTEDRREYTCVLCIKYNNNCRRCQLRVFATVGVHAGCQMLIDAVTGERTQWLSWLYIHPDDVGGIKNIRAIYNALEALPRV